MAKVERTVRRRATQTLSEQEMARDMGAPSHPSPDRIADEAAAIYPDTFDTPPTADEIAEEAYAIYQARGGDHGRDMDDWLEAERRVRQRRVEQTNRNE